MTSIYSKQNVFWRQCKQTWEQLPGDEIELCCCCLKHAMSVCRMGAAYFQREFLFQHMEEQIQTQLTFILLSPGQYLITWGEACALCWIEKAVLTHWANSNWLENKRICYKWVCYVQDKAVEFCSLFFLKKKLLSEFCNIIILHLAWFG